MSIPTLCVILGGGRGTRLYPLTRDRAKPAVPLAGKYRLVDIAVSNCINASLIHIYILTQFNSVSLNRHIQRTYTVGPFSRGEIMLLAAQQTLEAIDWFEGTADAVRKHQRHLELPGVRDVVILSGDHLYRMDLKDFLRAHHESEADVTVAAAQVPANEIKELGILGVEPSRRVHTLLEKPQEEEPALPLRLSPEQLAHFGLTDPLRPYLASMGIYIFRKSVLFKLLNEEAGHDFGRHILPAAIQSSKVFAYPFAGYWRDIGTIRSFYDCNLELAEPLPQFNFYDESAPIYTHPRYLPGSKIEDCKVIHGLLSDGCVVERATVERSLVGVRSFIRSGSTLKGTIMMGADYFETTLGQVYAAAPLGVGHDCTIENAILDKNVRIGDGVVLRGSDRLEPGDYENYTVRDGLIIVCKDAVIPPGTVVE
jgi:glucose-1-phosphate adenylyltransferase